MKVKSKKGVCIQASPSVATVDDAIDRLFNEISPLITAARERVAVGVNTELTKLNWNVGNCINRGILGRGRAEYGKQIVKGLASRLMLIHGSGWDEKSLRHCLRAAETFGEDEIVSATRRQLSWTHIKTLAYISDSLKRQFYLAVSKPNFSMLIAKIFAEKELNDSVVKFYLTTAADGKRYNVVYYALEMILAVGFRVRGVRGMRKGTRRLTTYGARRRRGLPTRRTWRSCDGLRTRPSDVARMENEDDIMEGRRNQNET